MPSLSSVCWSIPSGHLTDLSRRVEVLDAKKQSLPAFPWCISNGRMLYRFGYHYEHTPQSKHIRNNKLSFRMKLASFSLAKTGRRRVACPLSGSQRRCQLGEPREHAGACALAGSE